MSRRRVTHIQHRRHAEGKQCSTKQLFIASLHPHRSPLAKCNSKNLLITSRIDLGVSRINSFASNTWSNRNAKNKGKSLLVTGLNLYSNRSETTASSTARNIAGIWSSSCNLPEVGSREVEVFHQGDRGL